MKIKVIRLYGGKGVLRRGHRGWHLHFRKPRADGHVTDGYAWRGTLRAARQTLHQQLGPQ